MTRAYQEIYLSKAQSVLGDAFDYAVNTCNISGDDFTKLFMASTASRRMENGEPSLLAGKSGIEIAVDVVCETTGKKIDTPPQEHFWPFKRILGRLGDRLLPVVFSKKVQRHFQGDSLR